jgi:membrane protease subunit (stomatin/prohibitin family)
MLEIRAFGTYTFKVADAGIFLKEIVGTEGNFTTEKIAEQLKSNIVTRFTDAIGEANMPVENYASNLNELSMVIFDFMKDDFGAYGLEVSKFLIENISMPEEIKKEIFDLSRINKIDLNRFTQYKAAKSIEIAANNPSGAAGAGVGFGAGMAMANQMGQSINNLNTSQNQQSPPPLSNSISFFVALNNQQAGPFNETQLIDLVKTKQISAETLVWNQGMSDWQKASSVEYFQKLITQSPPPLPGI